MGTQDRKSDEIGETVTRVDLCCAKFQALLNFLRNVVNHCQTFEAGSKMVSLIEPRFQN